MRKGPPKTKITINLSDSLVSKLRARLADPINPTRTGYGQLSGLVEQVLREWCNTEQTTQIPELDNDTVKRSVVGHNHTRGSLPR